nr:hypothetical protein [Candidatus Gracilibacteria bacterium]
MEYGYNKEWFNEIRNSTTGRKDYDDYEEKIIDEINKKYRHLPPDKFNMLITKVKFTIDQHKKGIETINLDTELLLKKLKLDVDEHMKYMNSVKNTLYSFIVPFNGFDYNKFEFVRISDNTNENYPISNFLKGVIDELLALPEVIMMLGDSATRDALLTGLKNAFSTEGIINLLKSMGDVITDLGSGDAYKTGRSTVFTALTVLGVAGIVKGMGSSGARLASKISQNGLKQTIKDGVKGGVNTVKNVPKKVGKVIKKGKEKIRGTKPNSVDTQATVLKPHPDRLSNNINKILEKEGTLTDDEIRALDARRLDLKKQSSGAGVAKEELDSINKEVNLIESKIRNSQNGLNGAKNSSRNFEVNEREKVIELGLKNTR